jgi:predicted metalloendopeptidase
VEEDFNFKGRVLNGTTENLPRWKRCLAATDKALGEALGQLFVGKIFPPEAKARALEMVGNLEAALRSKLATLSWMNNATRQQAIAKLDAFLNKIGHPERWRDYSRLRIDRGSYVLNRMRANSFEVQRDLSRVGKPVDRGEWVLLPQAVDAGYVAAMNEVVFPAGILQPPFFNPEADDAINYGAIGAVIGHEMTHGFDDQGRQYDANGNLVDWWSPEDLQNFQKRAACIVNQFDSFEVEPDLHVNGKLVVGEAIADLGGLSIAYAAFQKSLAGKPRPKEIDGFTPEQRFFLGWARMWAENIRPEAARLQVNTNPHPLSRFRVNGPLANMPAFAQAFSCKEGDPMARPPGQRCEVW